MEDNDYSGKTLKLVNSKLNIEAIGLIVALDESVGLTVVNNDDLDDYFICVNGVLSPNYFVTSDADDKVCLEVIRMVKKCVDNNTELDIIKIDDMFNDLGIGFSKIPDKNMCPYK